MSILTRIIEAVRSTKIGQSILENVGSAFIEVLPTEELTKDLTKDFVAAFLALKKEVEDLKKEVAELSTPLSQEDMNEVISSI